LLRSGQLWLGQEMVNFLYRSKKPSKRDLRERERINCLLLGIETRGAGFWEPGHRSRSKFLTRNKSERRNGIELNILEDHTEEHILLAKDISKHYNSLR
jgi:hypothetical protein